MNDPESEALWKELELFQWQDERTLAVGEEFYDRLLGMSREDAVLLLGRLEMHQIVSREILRRQGML